MSTVLQVNMFKKVSREILNLIGELSQLFFTGNAQSISDKLGILFSENSYDFGKVFILLDKLKREIDEFPAKYRRLFLPYKYSMWDSLQSIHEADQKDPECEAYVMLIPYYDKDGSMLEPYCHTGKPAIMLDLGGTDSSVRDYDEGALSGKVHAGEVLREEKLGMGTVLEFCREYQYVPADFEHKETFGERIYKFSKEALVRKISK